MNSSHIYCTIGVDTYTCCRSYWWLTNRCEVNISCGIGTIRSICHRRSILNWGIHGVVNRSRCNGWTIGGIEGGSNVCNIVAIRRWWVDCCISQTQILCCGIDDIGWVDLINCNIETVCWGWICCITSSIDGDISCGIHPSDDSNIQVRCSSWCGSCWGKCCIRLGECCVWSVEEKILSLDRISCS